MKIKLDENMPVSASRVFAARGHECEHALDEDLGGHTDAHLYRVCLKEGRMLVTLDRGFGDIRLYRPGTHHGIVILRPRRQSPAAIATLISTLLDEHDVQEFVSANVVVDDAAVRIRRD